MKKYFHIIILVLLSQLFLHSQDSQKYMLSGAQILAIMDTSKVTYQPSFIEDTTGFEFPAYPVLTENYFITEKGDSSILNKYSLSDSGKVYFSIAESNYRDKNYSAAILNYKKIFITDPEYYVAYTLIGDCYYCQAKYDSAEYFLKLEINKNFIDYAAHWFLADTYKKIDNMESAVAEITIAHLLNRNNKYIFNILKKYREAIGKEWTEWEISPVCKTYKKDGEVIIETTKDWMGYAFAEAVWKYEPGFTENIFGQQYDGKSLLYQKEAAGIAANLNLSSMSRENSIIDDGYFQEMIWYEIISKKQPMAILLVPREFLNKMIKYVNKYH